MPIIHHVKRQRYTAIANECLEDSRLSWDARGVLAYLISRPEGWKIRRSHLKKIGNCGEHKISRIFRELEETGYLTRRWPQDAAGHFTGEVIDIHEYPENPDTGETGPPEKRLTGKVPHVVNTETPAKTEKAVSTEEKTPPSGGKKSQRKRRSPLTECPFDEQVPDEYIQEAVKKYGSGVDWRAEGELFVNHHHAKGSQFRDWKRAWWTWCRQPFKKHERDTGGQADFGGAI